ncbi:MAG: MscL family protein [Acholeplasmatales bacterium]|nr:MscL family protein [Acholeplasmatales bacterium]
MKKFFAEFKAFISRGNIIDMAVGVIIGGAFSAIVTALTNKILMPIVNWALSHIVGGEKLYTMLPNSRLATAAEIAAGSATVAGPDGNTYAVLNYIDWSAFIEAIINFIFVALTLFIILKVVMYVSKKNAELREKAKAKIAAKKAAGEEVTAEEAEEAAEPEPAPVDPVVELLQEIRDELKKNKEE